MFEIPEDLPFRLGPLAWLLGRWQGWGTVAGETEEYAKPVVQEIQVEVVGEQMLMRIKLFEGLLEEPFDPMWTANEGLDNISAGPLYSEESLYWSVDSPLALVPADGTEPRELRAVGSDTRGFAVLWAGVAMGPRIQLASDAVARAPGAKKIDYFSRMFGLVGGELMWASETMVGEGDYETEITGRLQRVNPKGGTDE